MVLLASSYVGALVPPTPQNPVRARVSLQGFFDKPAPKTKSQLMREKIAAGNMAYVCIDCGYVYRGDLSKLPFSYAVADQAHKERKPSRWSNKLLLFQ